MKAKKPTIFHARKINELLNHGLCKGLGEPQPGKMCVEAAVCYALGQDHSDRPKCVGDAVRSFKIVLNDADWSSNAARANGLREIAIAQLGSNTIEQRKFADIVVLENIRQILPLALKAAKLDEKYIKSCKSASTLQDAWAAARYAARSAAEYAAQDAAGSAAWSAAGRAARSAARSAAEYAARSAARDEILIKMAKIGVDALKQLNCPGVKFLSILK